MNLTRLEEWPVFNEGTRLQRSGKISHIVLTSNLIPESIILEMYNFDEHDQRQLGPVLGNLFQQPFDRVVGNSHKADYSLLQDQYPELKLPNEPRVKFVDVGQKAVARGLTTRGKGKTTLAAVCRLVKKDLKKPRSIRVGETWNCKDGRCAIDALEYLHLDGEAPMVADEELDKYPDITGRIPRYEPVNINESVDIMPDSKRALQAIAQGTIVQLGGICKEIGYVKLRGDQVLIEVTKVFNAEGVIHYPHSAQKKNHCACGRSSHQKIESECDFYMFQQYGRPSFHVIELKSRLRRVVEGYTYPSCVYESGAVDEDTIINLSFGDRRHQTTMHNFDENVVIVNGELAPETEESDDVEDIDDASQDDESTGELAWEQIQDLDDAADRFFYEGDEGESDDDDQDEPTEEQMLTVLAQEYLNNLVEKLIREADDSIEDLLSTFDNNMTLEDIEKLEIKHQVLGNIFHLMDRAKVPTHHSFKAIFFRALRSAMFIMHSEDVEKVKTVLETKRGESWEKKLAFDFDYIATRVRRFAPPPKVLHNRLNAVYKFFRDKDDAKSGKKLFGKKACDKLESVLKLVSEGYASDPSGVCLYVPKTDKAGNVMKDKDGLPLFRSLRGTSNLESFHQYITTSFGHTKAGPMYSDCILIVLRHFFNWRMSIRNQPNFPKLRHYDGLLIDRTNELYEELFGNLKYDHWIPFNEALPTDSPFGIVALDNEVTPIFEMTEDEKKTLNLNPNLSYLSR